MNIGSKVTVSNINSPLNGREFRIKRFVNEETVDLVDYQGNEITLNTKDIIQKHEERKLFFQEEKFTGERNTPRNGIILFELENTLIDKNGKINNYVLKQMKKLSSSYRVGILSRREREDPFLERFLEENFEGKDIPIVKNQLDENIELLFSSRVIRVEEDSDSICPMCLINCNRLDYTVDTSEITLTRE